VLARGSGGRDAQVRFGLREAEALRAVGEHRRTCLAGIEPPRIHLGDVCHELGFDPARVAHDLPEPEEEVVVGN